MGKKSKKLIRKTFAFMLAVIMAVPAVDYSALMIVNAEEEVIGGITIKERTGYEEGAYVEWSAVTGADGYQVYVSDDENAEENNDEIGWTLIDDQLIRQYEDYYRADALGLTAGTWYVKIAAVTFDENKENIETATEAIVSVEVTSHDRSGFAWQGYEGDAENNNINTPGAYKKDGTLKDNTSIIYVTNSTKDTVTLQGEDGTEYTGLQNIMNAYKQAKISNNLDVRIIGNVTDLAVMSQGDIEVENGNNKSAGITIEGIGEDAVVNGWGIRMKNASNIEIRNLGFMNCDSKEGDNVSAEQDNDHIWVHNCDLFYGQEGTDDDQKKGDGMLDCKKSDWVTFSYNHFWDSGKSCLLGLEENSNEYHATYHHNWFDHSDSRHPRVRYYTTHVYNNYYDGNSKYGIGGAAGGASIFAENNYFRNTKNPMLISMQGSDSGTFSGEDGSIIKAYGNYMDDNSKAYFIPYAAPEAATVSQQSEATGFVAYVALDDDTSVRDEEDSNANEDVTEKSDSEDADEGDASDVEEDVGAAADEIFNETTDTDDDNTSEDTVSSDLDADASAIYDEAEVLNDETASGPSVDFDAYVAENRDDKVPEEVKTKKGSHTYNNFDTEEGFYTYKLDDAEDVKDIVMSKAGRLNGGDLQFEFTDADDKSSDVNKELQKLCTDYKPSLVSIGGIQGATVETYYTVTFNYKNDETNPVIVYVSVVADTTVKELALPHGMQPPAGKVSFDGWYYGDKKWNFNTKVTGDMELEGRWLADGEEGGDDGLTPITETVTLTFSATGVNEELMPYFLAPNDSSNYDTQGGDSGTYNGIKYQSGRGTDRARLNLGVTTSYVKFRTAAMARVVLFLRPDKSGNSVKIDNAVYSQTNGILTTVVNSGAHSITPIDSDYLYAVMVEPIDASEKFVITVDKGDGSETTTLEVNAGDSITSEVLPDPTREGYVFAGWEDADGKPITLPYTPYGNMTIKATWYDGPAGVDMELLASDLTVGTISETLEKDGFTIYPTVSVANASVKVNNINYTARINTGGSGGINSRSISFDTAPFATLEVVCQSSSGSADRKVAVANLVGNSLVPYSGEIVREDSVTEIYNGGLPALGASAHSYTLKLTKAGTYYIYSPSSGVYIYAVRVTYDNSQESGSFTVTFKDGESTITSQTVNSGEKCTEPQAPAKDGYTFDGWYTDPDFAEDSKYDFNNPVTRDITLYAKWKKKPDPSAGDGSGLEGLYIEFVENLDDENYVLDAEGNLTVEYTGSAIKPEIIVTNTANNQVLTLGVDYTVKYANNTKVSIGAAPNKLPKVTVTGKGNLSGSAYRTFTIKAKHIGDATKSTIMVVKGQKLPVPSLYYAGVKLANNKDFTYTNTPLTVDDEIEITGQGNFANSTTKVDVKVFDTAAALKKASKKFTVTVDKNEAKKLVYTGGDLKEKIKEDVIKVAPNASDSTFETVKPYEIVFANDVTNAGTVKVSVVGLGDYSGCNVTKSVNILPKTVNQSDVKSEGATVISLSGGNGDLEYTSVGSKYDDLELKDVTLDDGKLAEGKDYKITYSGNKKVAAKKATYTITFMGNYKGKYKSEKFSITPAALASDTQGIRVDIPDKLGAKAAVYKSTPYVTIGGVLVNASEYKVEYFVDEECTKPVDNKTNKITPADDGTDVFVKITSKGKNFAVAEADKELKGSFKVWKTPDKTKDISKAKITFHETKGAAKKVTKVDYQGIEVYPTVIKVVMGTTPYEIEITEDDIKDGKLEATEAFPFECTFVNNINKGKATVIVKPGNGNDTFKGGKTATYSIAARKLPTTW